jgi:hypothetical protein
MRCWGVMVVYARGRRGGRCRELAGDYFPRASATTSAVSGEEAQLEAQHGGRRTEEREWACAWARAESTGESSHVYVLEIGCEIVSELF